MRQHLADLGVAAAAVDAAHQRGELVARRHPAGGAALGEPAEIDQLDIEPADRRRLAEHVALQRAGGVPGRLPAHGGVEREDQPPAFAGGRRRAERAHFVEEGLDLGLGRSRRRGAVFAHGGSLHQFAHFASCPRLPRASMPCGLTAPLTFGRGRRDTVLLAKAFGRAPMRNAAR